MCVCLISLVLNCALPLRGLQVVMKQNAVIEHLKQKKTMSPAEREENQR